MLACLNFRPGLYRDEESVKENQCTTCPLTVIHCTYLHCVHPYLAYLGYSSNYDSFNVWSTLHSPRHHISNT